MKLGVLSVVFGDKSWKEACIDIKKAGLHAVEVGAGGFVGKSHCSPAELLKDDKKLKSWVEAYESQGLELSALSTHGNPLHPDKSVSDQHAQDIKDAIALAKKIGAKVINNFVGCPGAGEDAVYPNWITCPWPPYFVEGWEWQWDKCAIPFWKEMAKLARDAGVKFGFEMHPGDLVFNPEALLKLRDAAGPEISCNLDPSHLFWQGIDPLLVIKLLGDAIVHVHAKDSRIDDNVVRWRGVNDPKHYSDIPNRAWTFRTVGYAHDKLFWNSFVSNLRMIGYDGVISIEHEDPLMSGNEGLTKAVAFLSEVLLYEDVGEMYWA
jgi:sugar phosphate isomerase/epimerase